MSKQTEILEDLATTFEALAEKPMPDPMNPTPLYLSRMHFDDWAERIRKAMVLQLEHLERIEDGIETDPRCGTRIHPGMSLRDYFAAKAMEATLADRMRCSSSVEYRLVAQESYLVADAMLAARNSLDTPKTQE